MNRILVTEEDVNMVLKWRNEHKDLVRFAPITMKDVEIISTVNDVRIRGIHKGDKLTLYVYLGEEKLGKAVFRRNFLGYAKEKMNLKLNEEGIQSVLTCYASIMAYIAYAEPVIIDEPPREKATSSTKKPSAKQRKKHNGPTYILQWKRQAHSKGGHHASPKGIFSVRGHFRHYKNGNTVWIAEYKKGTGKRKSKVYKFGSESSQKEVYDEN